jgi:hypothetical protein
MIQNITGKYINPQHGSKIIKQLIMKYKLKNEQQECTTKVRDVKYKQK